MTNQKREKFGFTLVELLVVIGIIAVLIGILLPALSKAREQANATKCMSALRSIGQAFQLYANEHKDFWPVVRQDIPDNPNQQPTANIYWSDMIGPYVTKGKGAFQITNEIEAEAARRSVLWGCPNYVPWTNGTVTNGDYFNGNTRHDTGYAMNYIPNADYDNPRIGYGVPTPGTKGFAIRWFGTYEGSYTKRTQWTRPSERMLVTDSMLWIMSIREIGPALSVVNSVPSQPATRSIASGSGNSNIDRYRHGKYPPVTGSAFVYDRSKSRIAFNILYCDGSARRETDYWQAYKSIFFKIPPRS